MDRIVKFERLSHAEYVPSTENSKVWLHHRKGDPVVKENFFGKEKVCKDEIYSDDIYCCNCGLLITRTELEDYHLGLMKCYIDSNGKVIDKPKVVLYFLNGDTLTKYFDTTKKAEDYFRELGSILTRDEVGYYKDKSQQ